MFIITNTEIKDHDFKAYFIVIELITFSVTYPTLISET